MTRRMGMLLAVALLVGCHDFDAALESYCDATGRCAVEANGAVCAAPRQQCSADLPCCLGAACVQGACVTSAGATVTLEPASLDFGNVPVGTHVERAVVLRNGGEAPAYDVTLAVRPEDGTFTLDTAGCALGSLAPGAECSLVVRFSPAALGPHHAVVAMSAMGTGTQSTALSLQGVSGAVFAAQVSPAGWGSVHSEPTGLTCPGTCSSYFPLAQPVTMVATPALGTRFVRWSGACAGTEPRCEVTVTGREAAGVALFEGLLDVESVHVSLHGGTVDVRSGTYNGTCEDRCQVPAGGTVRLYARQEGDVFAGWEGACEGAGLEPVCTLQVTAPTFVRARFKPLNVAFVTDASYAPSTFGPDGSEADRICAYEAAVRRLPINTYRAWLSSSTRSARGVLGPARGWLHGNGRLADTVDALVVAGAMFEPFSRWPQWEDGTWVATGASPAGDVEPDAAATCGDWSDPQGTYLPGNLLAATGSWTRDAAAGPRPCSFPTRLYCFGTDHTTPLPSSVTPTSGRAFLSSPWVPEGGISGADARCAADASAAGLDGTYVAALAPSGTSVEQRLGELVRRGFLRVDGERVESLGTPTQGGLWAAPLNVTADGQYVGGASAVSAEALVWTGGPRGLAGTREDTCNDWSGGTGSTGRVGRPELPEQSFDAVLPGSGSLGRVGCDVARRLYCLER